MMRKYRSYLVVMFCVLLWFAVPKTAITQPKSKVPEKVEFNRDIRPIISNTCFTCHGPDNKKRKADLRFDKEAWVSEGLIEAGKSGESEFFRRLVTEDEDERMPPKDAANQLTKIQIETIKRWIDQGAKWQDHWSFTAPVRAPLPKTQHQSRVKNAIDNYVLARLEAEGMKPSEPASQETLIRRVTFDLTGLPPTLAEIDAFVADKSPNAYEKVVDRLLKSPHYGENMARFWLDAARYGDTHGLHLDNERSIWPYRDWVINAFNTNKTFDEFTIEQIAGDLLPKASLQQKIASGFNRCNVTTSEGGSIAEEYRVRYAVDRVETLGTVWLGMTFTCSICHDHKYDPFAQAEFYQLFAYYAKMSDKPMDGNVLLPPPSLQVPTKDQEQRMAALKAQLPPIQIKIKEALTKVKYVEPPKSAEKITAGPQEFVWIDDAIPAGGKAEGNEGAKSWNFVSDPAPLSGSTSSSRTSTGLSQHFFTGAKPPLKIGKGDKLFAYVYLDPKNPPKEIMLQFNDGSWDHRAVWGENLIDWGKADTPSRRLMGKLPELGKWVRLEVDAAHVGLPAGKLVNGWAFTQFDGTTYWDRAGLVTKTPQDGMEYESLAVWEQFQKTIKKSTLPSNIQAVLKIEQAKRNEQQQKTIQDYFVENVYAKTRDIFAPLNQEKSKVDSQIAALNKEIPSTLISTDLAAAPDTFVLIRGEYDKPDKEQKVQPGVPAALSPLPKDAKPDRLSLARWLVDRQNPLTARVTVNRYWQQYFGIGLVKTTEDFGSQGEPPSHPQLFDWLAVEFMESGWDVKQLQKLIVMSNTYQQASEISAEALAKDPENRLFSHGPRFRLDAEMIRDNALAISGLLVKTIGGKSVKPYQPVGLWKAVGYTGSNTVNFKVDSGDALYRRGMYTFWKRTSPPPTMSTFDAPSREQCTVSRARTNTPLQALVLMNDVQYVEAARNLAQRVMTEGGKTFEDRITFTFRLATSRKPNTNELSILKSIYDSHSKEYQADVEAAKKLISVGESKADPALNVSELATWTMISNLILNLNETITKG